MGTFSESIESSPRIRRGEDSIEPVPGETAEPPATGKDEQLRAAVGELVAKLPWIEWAKQADRTWRPSVEDAEQVQTAILDAVIDSGITLDQAAEIACAAMREATGTQPVTYVTRAFTTKLTRWLRVIKTAELADDPLPLAPNASAPTTSVEPAAADGGPSVPDRSYCPRCKAPEGSGPGPRMRRGEDGRMRHCECRAASIAA